MCRLCDALVRVLDQRGPTTTAFGSSPPAVHPAYMRQFGSRPAYRATPPPAYLQPGGAFSARKGVLAPLLETWLRKLLRDGDGIDGGGSF